MKASQDLLVGPRSSEEGAVYGRVFWVLVAVSLAVRVLALWLISGSPLASDSTDYREMASLLLRGGHFVPYWPPGLSLYLAPFLAAGRRRWCAASLDAGLVAAVLLRIRPPE